MTLEEKLKLWVEITGVDPNEKRNSWTLYSNKLSDYDISKMNDSIKSILEFSDMKFSKETMTEIVLRNFFIEFLKDRKLSLYDMVVNKDNDSMLSKCRLLMENLSITEDEIDMKNIIKNALDFYGKDICIEDIDMYEVVSLYVSAKNNIEKLRTVQFKKGKHSNIAPKFSKEVYLFNSIDEVINGINSYKENVVMLCYIHDVDESSGSYFCYVIKNEENVYLLGDMPKYAHPYQKFLSRCPSRHMAERINASFFPYSIAGVDLSNRYNVNDEHNKEENFKSLGLFKDMELSELIWNIYMLQGIKEKFFNNEFNCLELSYTGNMLNTPLLEKSETTLTIYNSFPSLSIPVFKSIHDTDDLTFGSKEYPHESQHLFDNVITRFNEKINLEEIQLFNNSDTVPLIVDKDAFGRDITTDLLAINTNSFGTKNEIEKRSKWILRFNYAVKINELAKKEYQEKNNEIREWFEQKVLDNLPNIIEKAIKDEFRGKSKVISNWGYSSFNSNNKDENGEVSLVSKYMANNVNGLFFYPKNRYKNISEYECLLTKKHGTICLTVSPYDSKNLCEMLNITKNELPDPIKNWCACEKRNVGNHLLDDYDPLDWVIKDYWYNMNFSIALILSKTAYSQKRKEYGLPEDKFWLNK